MKMKKGHEGRQSIHPGKAMPKMGEQHPEGRNTNPKGGNMGNSSTSQNNFAAGVSSDGKGDSVTAAIGRPTQS